MDEESSENAVLPRTAGVDVKLRELQSAFLATIHSVNGGSMSSSRTMMPFFKSLR